VQQRSDVGLVEDPRPRRQQVGERQLAEDRVAIVTGPGQEGPIGLQDEPAGMEAQVPAGRLLVERFGVVDEEGLLERSPCRRLGLGDVRPSS
jgi:hypothetical protein